MLLLSLLIRKHTINTSNNIHLHRPMREVRSFRPRHSGGRLLHCKNNNLGLFDFGFAFLFIQTITFIQ